MFNGHWNLIELKFIFTAHTFQFQLFEKSVIQKDLSNP